MQRTRIAPLTSFRFIGTRQIPGELGKSERTFEVTWEAGANPLEVENKARALAVESVLRRE
jgi:hypothetical protein